MSRRGEKPKSIADGRFEIETKLGEGSFGEVYRGTDKRTQQKVAIKFEEGNTSAPGSLKNEAYLLDMLRRPYQRHGFVEVLHFSRIGRYSVLVMELLGQSLEDCMSTSGGKFSIGTTTLIAEQSLHRIEYLHSKCIVHRDIKPDNFLWGTGRKAHHLYLIDFGLSVKYWDKRHASMSTSNSLTGTARYASVNAHRGATQSRRDDLEAIGHMLMYFLRGSLPWSGLKAKTQEEKFRKIADTKERYPLADLCKGFPDEFRYYLQYCRNLGFKERPDYAMLQKNFRELRKREGIVEDYELQFINPNEVDVKTLIPMDPGCGHQQPDDAPGRTSKHCFYWRRSVVPSIPKDKE
mmetsp:Transcript_57754/g.122858  ORF Transcript_57754/g.122858 Transcript_57754/m.122858 type:complete len:349 (+) Transcript_57754:188-1234(+)